MDGSIPDPNPMHKDSITIDSIQDVLTEEEPIEDVLVIAEKLLKQAAHLNTHATLKIIMTLTAVISYVKLYQRWKNTRSCKQKQPAKTASMEISACMGKGSSFSRKICQMVPYISHHHCLPDQKTHK